jgi:hypothetical protein
MVPFHVIEVGGAGTLPNSLKSVAVQGQVSWVGVLAPGEPMISLAALRSAFANLRFVAVGSRSIPRGPQASYGRKGSHGDSRLTGWKPKL